MFPTSSPPVVTSIFGRRMATTVRLPKRYGHIGQIAQVQPAAWLEHLPESKAEPSDAAPLGGPTITATAETLN